MKSIITISLGVVVVLLLLVGFWLYTPDKSQAELEATYATAPSKFVEIAGMRMHIRDTGPADRPALIMLHGFGANLGTWDAWAEALSTEYRVVRFDLPGFGLTGPDPTGDYTDPRSIAVLLALMDQLQLERATMIGNSMGGRIAWTFAALHPERVTKLVLIAPDGFASPGFEYGKKAEVPASLDLMRYTLPTIMVRASLAPAYGDPSKLREPMVTRYRDLMLGPGVRNAMIERLKQVFLENPEPILSKIQAPTLLMWGEKDAMIPFRNAADYARFIPNSTLVSFPKLGHVPHEEAVEETAGVLRQFLQQ